MTETVAGGGAPLPPKRPTIIRPSTNSCTNGKEPKRPVPSRPAPVRPPPSPKGAGDGVRPVPPVPSRPAPKSNDGSGESGRPAVPPPSASKIPPRPSAEKSTNSRTSVKKRPEITIVSAKPMSQVGFRDEKQNPKPEEKPVDTSVSRPPPRPVPPPHTAEEGGNAPMRPRPPSSHIRPPPPNKSSGSSLYPNLLDDDSDQSGLPPPMPLFNPSSGPLKQESEHPPPPPPRTDLLGDTSLSSSHPVPSSKPPPPPMRPVRHDDKPIIPARGASSDLSVPEVVPRGVPAVLASRPIFSQSDGGEEGKPLPPKPAKPTIIRPTKPLPSPREENRSISSKPVLPNKPAAEESKSDSLEQSVIQKSDSSNSLTNKPEPQYARIEKPKPKPNIIGRPQWDPNSNESDTGQGLPFKVKLRSTVETPKESLAKEHDESSPPLPPKLYVEGRPPSPTKPRPTVLPRPKPSPDIEEKKIVSDDHKDDMVQAPPPKPTTKRPTIIRPPPKPKRLHETEEITDEESKDKDTEVTMRNMPPVPAKRPSSVGGLSSDTVHKEQDGSTSPRPVPAKRPVSIAARFEQQVDSEKQPVPARRPPPPKKSSSGSPREDSESGRSGTEEETSPKHVPVKPRAKPRSVPSDSSSPDEKSPREAPLVREAASPEDTPAVSRPPPPRRPSDNSDEGVSRPPPPRPSGRPISMMTSKPETTEDEDESPKMRPPRPAGRPMSMITQKKTEEVSGNVEEESSKGKPPPRPAGRPMPSMGKKSTSDEASQEEEEDSPKAKPLRPSGPPQRRQPAEEKDEKVEMRPSRSKGGPPRPMSMPAKPPPPTGGSSHSKKLPVKPSPPKAGARTPDLPPRPGPDHILYHYTLSVPHAIANFDYQASHDDEISFKAEEVVMLVRRVDADWLVGRVGAKEGMFPAGFVDIVHPLHDEISDFAIKPDLPSWDSPLPVKKSTPSVTSGPRCVARFDFDGEGKDDLVFEEDDVIRLVGRVGSEWLRGELGDRVGIFPISFVEIVEDLPLEDTDYKSQDGRATAMFDFEGQGDELSFQAGQKIQVISQVNTEWLYGQMDGRSGTFPSAFIDYIPSDLPQYQPANQIKAQSHDPWSASDMMDASHDVDNHDKVMADPSSTVTDQSQPYCLASFDYEGEQDGDLSFKTGETIQLVEKIGIDWLRGRCNGREGMFPAAFVTIEKDLPDAKDEPASHIADEAKPQVQARALYDFQGESDQELSFKVGDVILLGDTVAGSPDWRFGDLDGKSGMFPAAFVEVIS